MFSLQKHPVKIQHLNVRTENHGDEEVTAVDIKLGFDVPNVRLDELRAGLREALYEMDPNADPSLLDEGDHLTHVRFPQLSTKKGRFSWSGSFEEVGLHLHLGNGRGKGDLHFVETKLNNFFITIKEGGTCSCEARAQVLPTPDETTKLVGLLSRVVPTSIDMDDAIVAEPRRKNAGDAEEEEVDEETVDE